MVDLGAGPLEIKIMQVMLIMELQIRITVKIMMAIKTVAEISPLHVAI